jgi:hypothetical protein
MTGCSLFGGKFGSQSSKLKKAAEKVCDAEKASDKLKKQLIKNKADPEDLEDGAYVTLNSDEAEDADFGFEALDGEEIKKAFVFMKVQEEGSLIAMVIQSEDEDMCEDLIEEMEETYNMIDDDLIQVYQDYGYEAVMGSEDDDAYYAKIYKIIGSGLDDAGACYVKGDGKIITVVIYTGISETDLFDEFLDFMNEAKLTDMEELLDD